MNDRVCPESRRVWVHNTFMAIIRQFHNGVLARVQDNGEKAAPYTQCTSVHGVKQAVRSPLALCLRHC